VPRFAGTGLLLPTAAAATLVLTATGASLGSSPRPLTPGLAANTMPSPTATLADGRQGLDLTTSALAAESRLTQQRADRDQDRQRLNVVAADSARRQAEEKARTDAAGRALAVAQAEAQRVASAHRWVPFLTDPYTLTSGFGMRWGTLHPGQDFAVPVGTPVKAMSSGTVLFAGWSGGYGNKVEIQYWDGTISWMAHNSVLKVTQGEQVTPGEVVALSGNTGHSTGAHSHVEIHLKGDNTTAGAIPPIPWLTAKGIMPGAAGAPAPAGATD